MKTFSLSIAVALAGIASVGTPTSARATAVCDQQFQQCLDDGVYPVYKCEQLRALCEDMYSFNAQPKPLLNDKRPAWLKAANPEPPSQPTVAPYAP